MVPAELRDIWLRSGSRVRRAAVTGMTRRLNRHGYLVLPRGERRPFEYPEDFDDATRATCEAVRPFTLTRPERIAALRQCVKYVVDAGVPGAFVECGVWHGGSMMVVARTLLELGVGDRDLFLFDTFGAIPRPRNADVDIRGHSAVAAWERYDAAGEFPQTDEVVANVRSTGYPAERIHPVVGDVAVTVPDLAPDVIALLRLDTDYYESTAHELRHLYPRVADRGMLLVDDYGHFAGARAAVDEYFAEQPEPPLLHRVDYTARVVQVRRQ